MFHVKQDQKEKIEIYVKLIKKYHNTLDLISSKGLEQIDQKIQDAIKYTNVINGSKRALKNENIIDIGSGIGLPGIIEAILLPQYQISLVERRQKRATFLKIVQANLRLENVKIYHNDVKDLRGEKYSVVTALAVGTFKHLYYLTCHLHTDSILLISRKGEDWREEITTLELHINQKVVAEKVNELSTHGSLIKVLAPGGISCQ